MPLLTWNRRRFVAAIGVVLAITLITVVLTRRTVSIVVPPTTAPASNASDNRSVDVPGSDQAQTPNDLSAPTPVDANRQHAPLQLQVVTALGEPLAGTTVTHTLLVDDWVAQTSRWPQLDWTSIEAFTVSANSDERGFASLALPEHATGQTAVIWATHPGFRAEHARVDAASRFELPSRITLRAEAPLRVTVVNAAGEPIEGASVSVMHDIAFAMLTREGRPLSSADASDLDRDLADRLALHRTELTGRDGTALIPAVEGRHWVEARFGDLRSAPWRGNAPAHPLLRLQSTFTAQGTVHFPVGSSDHSGLSVRCTAIDWWGGDLLAHANVDANGTWGPIQLPRVPCKSFLFQLNGGELTDESKSIAPPDAVATVNIDFDPALGGRVSVIVSDTNDTRLELATVMLQWSADNAWHSILRLTDAEGRAQFRDAPVHPTWLRVDHPGHATFVSPAEFDVQRATEPIFVRLEKAGTIRGRALHKGTPVRDFTVLYWRATPDAGSKIIVRDSLDGSFEITNAPLGEVTLVGTSDVWPRAAPVVVTVDAERASDVVLEFADALVGRGMVVDALTNEPVTTATIQPFIMHQKWRVSPWQAPVPVSADGSFEIAAFTEGRNLLLVSAPGYALKDSGAFGSVGREIDFGRITLSATQRFVVAITGAPGTDWSQFQVALEDERGSTQQGLDANGTTVFEDMSPAHYSVTVTLPDESTLIRNCELQPGHDLKLEIALDTTPIEVEIVADSEVTLPNGLWLTIDSTVDPFGARERSAWIPETRRVQAYPPRDVPFLWVVHDASNNVWAMKQDQLSPTATGPIRVHIDNASTEFEVVDSRGAPLVGATVNVALAAGPVAWRARLDTDSAGRCTLRTAPPGNLIVSVRDPTLGFLPGRDVGEARNAHGPIRLVMNPEGRMRVRVLEAGRPISGITLVACDGRTPTLVGGSGATDGEGIAQWDRVMPGTYRIQVRDPAVWSDERLVEFDSDATVIDVSIRRLGGLDVAVKDSYATGVENVAVDLWSEADSVWVSQWIAEGRVPRPTNSSRTDAQGAVRFSGLPRGEYRVQIEGHESEDAENRVTVPAASFATIELLAP